MSYDLDRFVTAQSGAYDKALVEMRRGLKTSHWMWFIFPQHAGLGHSATAQHFAIRSMAEAQAYLDHPVLGDRLRIAISALPDRADLSAEDIFGPVDAMKLRSSLTLFAMAGHEPAFEQALDRWFAGRKDEATLELLSL